MKKLLNILPWFLLALFVVEIVAVLLPKRDGELHTREFGRLPVLLNGRIQPFDSVARNSLLQIRSTGDLPLEIVPSWQRWRHVKKLRSTEWLLELMFKPEVADTRYVFLIHHPDLISEFKLEDKGIEKSGLRYYTFNDLQPVGEEIMKQGSKVSDIEAAQRTPYQKQVFKLANAVFLYQRLKNSIQPEGVHDFEAVVKTYEAILPAGIAAFRAQRAGEKVDTDALQKLGAAVKAFDDLSGFALPLTIPPLEPEKNRHAWQNIGTSLVDSLQTGEIHPAAGYFARMATAYGQDQAAEFNKAVAEYKTWLQPKFARELSKGRWEYYFNQIKAFLHATIIYIVAFLCAGAALLTTGDWPKLSESFRRSAYYLIGLAFVVHTFGLLFRMLLEGRPPVTNLYSSAIFIGWGACLLGLILERIYKVGLGCAVAGLAGFVTLLIAHNLALGGDTMEMLQAVLDTNFWLATHVVVVTLGYASTFVAGTLALAYVILGVFTPLLRQKFGQQGMAAVSTAAGWTTGAVASAVAGPVVGIAAGVATAKSLSKEAGTLELGKALSKMVYAIICFATLFSFVGTVLGGIWADQSWGRFWGWDPKENGALIIVLWNVLILHARWGGLVRDRGIMNLAIFGNIVTSFSWFGVNMLGIGLHSYGFMDAAFKWLMLFVGSQVALILLGSLPLHVWKSFQSTAPATESSSDKTDTPAPEAS